MVGISALCFLSVVLLKYFVYGRGFFVIVLCNGRVDVL